MAILFYGNLMRIFFSSLIQLFLSNPAYASDMNIAPDNALSTGIEKCRQEDYPAAFTILRPLAEQGNADAQYWMGACHEWRRGQDFSTANGVSEDATEALRWYRRAAEQDHTQAQTALGHLLTLHYMLYVRPHPGDFDKVARHNRDLQEAFRWFLKAAEQGDPHAQSALGFSYQYSHGVEHDLAQSLKWYLLAAGQGIKTAPNSIGDIYARGGVGVAKDPQAAFSWYRQGAGHGDSSAQFNLGISYLNGDGIEKDEQQAFHWIGLAAGQGMSRAQLELGRMYANGIGTQQDQQQAITWFRKAAKYRYEARQELERLENNSDQVQSTD